MSEHDGIAPALAARLLSMLDLTSLGEDDRPEQVAALCTAALRSPVAPAALCVYPEHLCSAAQALAGSGVRLATVINFPDGGDNPVRVQRETRRALAVGADEIDLVLPYRSLLAGHALAAERVVQACREVCGEAVTLKLIVESGELVTAERIRQACQIGLAAGVDFLKTSTGKVAVNATLDAAAVILDVIAETGGYCGFKAAGGVRSPAQAASYLALAERIVGTDWARPANFRIGASTLFDALLNELSAPA